MHEYVCEEGVGIHLPADKARRAAVLCDQRVVGHETSLSCAAQTVALPEMHRPVFVLKATTYTITTRQCHYTMVSSL